MPKGVYERKKNLKRSYKRSTISAEERFWAKVNKYTLTDCWHWIGGKNEKGYGQLIVNGRMIKAHRFSYELHKGPIPEGKVVMHSCDNRKCVNPEHLSIGTQAENMLDMKNKNRQARGSSHTNCKLNEDQVKEIKIKLNLGLSQRKIANEYGIHESQISLIKTGRTWKDVNI